MELDPMPTVASEAAATPVALHAMTEAGGRDEAALTETEAEYDDIRYVSEADNALAKSRPKSRIVAVEPFNMPQHADTSKQGNSYTPTYRTKNKPVNGVPSVNMQTRVPVLRGPTRTQRFTHHDDLDTDLVNGRGVIVDIDEFDVEEIEPQMPNGTVWRSHENIDLTPYENDDPATVRPVNVSER